MRNVIINRENLLWASDLASPSELSWSDIVFLLFRVVFLIDFANFHCMTVLPDSPIRLIYLPLQGRFLDKHTQSQSACLLLCRFPKQQHLWKSIDSPIDLRPFMLLVSMQRKELQQRLLAFPNVFASSIAITSYETIKVLINSIIDCDI